MTTGILLGLSAGISPGPLLTLVISETLQHDARAGVRVALAPLITDLPIVVLTLLILAKLSDFHSILGVISLAGGVVVLSMGYGNMRTKGPELKHVETKRRPLTKGLMINTLSPHPYLFWLSIGGPIVTKAMSKSVVAPLVFVGSFYVLLVGCKILLAILVGRSKAFLSGKAYIYTMRFLGLALCVLALALFRDGLRFLGMLQAQSRWYVIGG